MKIKRLLIIAIALVIVGIASCWLFSTPKLQTAKFHAKKISTAIRAYSAEMKAKNLNLPPSIPLQKLVENGFLNHRDVSAWDGWSANVLLTTNQIYPQTALMNVEDKDGNQATLIADGSMQFKK